MGVSYSCNGTDYDALDESLEALIMRTISFKGGDNGGVGSAIRSLSFNGRERSDSSILKAFGSSGKMIIEGSLSFNGRDMDPFHVETKISITSPRVHKMDSIKTAPGLRPSRFKEAAQRILVDVGLGSPKDEAAVKLQKVYKSFRTRRKLADCAVLVEQRWWKLLDFALLKRSSVSFFDIEGTESVISRWSRARTRAAKVGQGLSKDEKARKLALQHWLEAIDPRHRYGHNLHFYYSSWLHCESRQPFFYWLDVGEGREVNLERCPRSKLQQQCIKYLGPKEREAYEVVVKEGRFIYKQKGQLLDTSEGPKDSKWIFVLSTSKKLYVGQKKKGTFQHSSFLAGGATSAAGRLVVDQGILKAVWPHSGHYRPTEENFQEFVSFLRENNVDLTDVKKSPEDGDEDSWTTSSSIGGLSSQSSLPSSTNDVTAVMADLDRADDAQRSHGDGEKTTTADIGTKRSTASYQDTEGPGHGATSSASSLLARSELLKGSSALDRLYALCIQKLFKEFEGESDEDTDDKPRCEEESKTTTTAHSSEEPTCSTCNSSAVTLPGLDEEGLGESATTASEQHYKRNLFEEEGQDAIEIEEPDIPQLIMRRINSKKGTESYQLGKQLSCKWTTGAGPRIGFVRDYPSELQFQALEQVNLSPRSARNLKLGNASSPHSLPSPTPKSPGMSSLGVTESAANSQSSR